MSRYRRKVLVLAVSLCLVLSWASGGGGSVRASAPRPGTPSTPITNVIIFMLENHTFNNLFGQYPGVQNGQLLPEAPNPTVSDFSHLGASLLAAEDGGQMDEFPAEGRTQYTQADLPIWWQYAQQFGLADNFFSSINSNSTPNHVALIAAGQTGGIWDSTNQTSGCNTQHNSLSLSRNTAGAEYWSYGCYNIPSNIPALLASNGLSWRYYTGSPIFDAPAIIQSLYGSPSDVHNPNTFTNDINNGKLATVSWVIPPFGDSDHPPLPLQAAQNWVSQQVNLVMQSTYWAHTAIFISWDDWGGFYDPVYPPQVDGLGMGLRVPLLVISPYARAGYISHQLGEFSSFAKFIETNWGLPNLGQRDALSSIGDLMDFFDFSQAPQAPLLLSPIAYQSGLSIPAGSVGNGQSIFGAINPKIGTTNTTFTYSVIYSLAGTPATHNVTIDGAPHPMVSKGAVQGGVLYQYTTKLALGSHTASFTFSNSTGGQFTIPYNGPYQYPSVYPFSLSAAKVPSTLLYGQPATYSVHYVSPQNKAPVLAEIDIDGVAHAMTTTGTNFKAGVNYTYTANNLFIGGHTYRLRFDDGSGTEFFYGTLTPRVTPLLLTGSLVSPASGTASTLFTFSTTYTDAGGQTPISALLYVDQSAHPMSYVSGSMSTGALYQAQLTLSAGSHTFDFVFADGSSSWADPLGPAVFGGPSVTAFAGAVVPAQGPPVIIAPSHSDDPDYPLPGDDGSLPGDDGD